MALLETGISLNLDIKTLSGFKESLSSIQGALDKISNPFAAMQQSLALLNASNGVSTLTEKFKTLNEELKQYKASALYKVNIQAPKSEAYQTEQVNGLKNINTQKFVGVIQKNAINQEIGDLKINRQNILNLNEYEKGIIKLESSEAKITTEKLRQQKIVIQTKLEELKIQKALEEQQRLNEKIVSSKNKNPVLDFAKGILGGYLSYQGVKLLTNSIINARLEYEKTLVVFTNILPSYGFNKSVKEREKMSEDLFRNISSFAKKYKMDPYAISTPVAQFMGTRLTGFDLNSQLATAKNILKLTSQFQLSPEQTNNVVLAFGQIASKGIVSMEEFRRQLGNYMPGFTDMMAKAMKITPAQLTSLISSGTLTASTFFKALNRQVDVDLANYKPAANLTNSLIALKVAFKDMVIAFSGGTFSVVLRKLIDGLTMLLNIITKMMPIIKIFMTLWLTGFVANKIGSFGGITSGLKTMGIHLATNTILLKNMRDVASSMYNVGIFAGNKFGVTSGEYISRYEKARMQRNFVNSASSQKFAMAGGIALAAGGGLMYASDLISDKYQKTKTITGYAGSILSGAGSVASIFAPLMLIAPAFVGAAAILGGLAAAAMKFFGEKKKDELNINVSATNGAVVNSVSSTKPITISTTSLTSGMLGVQY